MVLWLRTLQHGTEIGPGVASDTSRRRLLETSYLTPLLEPPKTAHRGPKRAPRGAPEGPQEGPKTGLRGKRAPGPLQDPSGAPPGPPRSPPRPPSGPSWTPSQDTPQHSLDSFLGGPALRFIRCSFLCPIRQLHFPSTSRSPGFHLIHRRSFLQKI